MKKHKHALILLAVLILLSASSYFFLTDFSSDEVNERVDTTDTQVTEETLPEPKDLEEVVQEISQAQVQQIAKTVTTLYCDDCLLAPVDKFHQLQSTYAPSVVSVNVEGGGQLISVAVNEAEEMFSAMAADGISNASIRSSYRSYQTQVATFEKWVNQEMTAGISRAEAEAIANTYSARPGQSEHQLGTTLDILCSGCSFSSNSSNEAIWSWLADNAQDFGFVLSYPDGREAETGYTYEPWHYRYIGELNATAFNSQSKTLNNWLIDQGNY